MDRYKKLKNSIPYIAGGNFISQRWEKKRLYLNSCPSPPSLLVFSPLRKHFSDWVPGSSRVGQILNGEEGGLCVFSFVFFVCFCWNSHWNSQCVWILCQNDDVTCAEEDTSFPSQLKLRSGLVSPKVKSHSFEPISCRTTRSGLGVWQGWSNVGGPDDDGYGRRMEKDRFSYEEKMCQSLLVVCQQCFLLVVFSPSVLIKDIDAHSVNDSRKRSTANDTKAYCLIMIAWWLMT